MFGIQHRMRFFCYRAVITKVPVYLYFCHVIDDFACLDLQH